MSSNPSPYSSPISQDSPKTSGMAIASLVLGLLSFLTCLITGLPAIVLGIIGLGRINQSQGHLKGRGMAITGIVTGSMGSVVTVVGMLVGLLLPAVNSARESAQRAVSMNQMRQIGIAMHQYENTKQHLPARASLSADGKPLLSWRVLVLPYLQQEELYKQFHLDEPWNSPHNRTLIDLMPQLYASPSDPSKSKTLFLVPYGPGTIFDGTKPKSLGDIARGDGLSNTILLVEADPEEAVIWTKPDDWEFHPGDPTAGLGHLRSGGFIAVMADGSVHMVPTNRDKKTLAAMFTMDDGESIPAY